MKYLIILFIIIVVYLIICYLMFLFIFASSKSGLFKIIDNNINKMLIPYKSIYDEALSFIKKTKYKTINIKSFDNITLNGIFFDNKKSKYIMILLHGYRSTKERDIFASLKNYYDMGYSLFVPDMRGCGKSKYKYITFGYKEKYDIEFWINYLNKKYHKDIILAGVSLGASSILLTNNKNVKLIIADCPYNDAYKEISYVIKHYFHLPSFIFMNTISLYAKILINIKIKDINVKKNLDNLNIPILLIHGKEDYFVKPSNSIEIYKYYKGKKELLLVEGADHGMSFLVNKKLYIDTIKSFLDKHLSK